MKLTIRYGPRTEVVTMTRVDDLSPERAQTAKKFWGLYQCLMSDGATYLAFGDHIAVTPEVTA